MNITLILQLFLQLLTLSVWLLIIPFLTGLLMYRFVRYEHRTPGIILIFGLIIHFAVFELVGIIVVLNETHDGMATLVRFFTPLAITLAALGLGTEIVKRRQGTDMAADKPPSIFTYIKVSNMEAKILWLVFFLILGFQLFMALTRASFDGDDAFYIAQSLIARERGFLYRVLPYTGGSTVLNMRSALAVFPLWISLLAEKSRLHPTIIAHSLLPLFLLPLTYLLYFQIGKNLLKEKLLPVFMIFMAIIQMFGNVSIFTSETFLMTRTWQGKSLAANFFIPAVLWLFLLINAKQEKQSSGQASHRDGLASHRDGFPYYLMLAILLWATGISSSLAVFLALGLAAILSIFMAVYHQNSRILLKTALAFIPAAVYVLLYVILV